MLELLQTHPLHLLAIAVIGFIIGRMTAPNPIERERERQGRETAIARHRATLNRETLDAVRRLMRDGKKLEAIKLVRGELGIDLRAAKDLVEQLGA